MLKLKYTIYLETLTQSQQKPEQYSFHVNAINKTINTKFYQPVTRPEHWLLFLVEKTLYTFKIFGKSNLIKPTKLDIFKITNVGLINQIMVDHLKQQKHYCV